MRQLLHFRFDGKNPEIGFRSFWTTTEALEITGSRARGTKATVPENYVVHGIMKIRNTKPMRLGLDKRRKVPTRCCRLLYGFLGRMSEKITCLASFSADSSPLTLAMALLNTGANFKFRAQGIRKRSSSQTRYRKRSSGFSGR